mgnify:CR=1 FL=1|tara:strand:+ start:40 stop:456 length:417 start_codon:yes stop_codon:yes gene_type:complete
MNKVLLILIFSYFFSLPALTLTNKDLTNKQLLCPKLLWGVEFISSDRVRVIKTDLNKKTSTNEYSYVTDLELSFINIFKSENNIRDRVYSIELNTLRVDVWTMTGGGFTTREMFPKGLCEFVNDGDIYSQIKNLKLVD